MDHKEIIDEIIYAFHESGFETEGERLTVFKLELMSDSQDTRLQAAEKIIGFCHPKVWGDLAVSGKCQAYKTLYDWDRALARLSKFAKQIKVKSYKI